LLSVCLQEISHSLVKVTWVGDVLLGALTLGKKKEGGGGGEERAGGRNEEGGGEGGRGRVTEGIFSNYFFLFFSFFRFCFLLIFCPLRFSLFSFFSLFFLLLLFPSALTFPFPLPFPPAVFFWGTGALGGLGHREGGARGRAGRCGGTRVASRGHRNGGRSWRGITRRTVGEPELGTGARVAGGTGWEQKKVGKVQTEGGDAGGDQPSLVFVCSPPFGVSTVFPLSFGESVFLHFFTSLFLFVVFLALLPGGGLLWLQLLLLNA